MKYYVLAISLIVANLANPVFSQENPAPALKAEAEPAANEISIYGEVQGANTTENSLSVQYYDYDTDEEKTIDVVLTKDTKLENTASITDIKSGDWVDVTYMVSDNKNIAKSVTVEKEETAAEETPVGAAEKK